MKFQYLLIAVLFMAGCSLFTPDSSTAPSVQFPRPLSDVDETVSLAVFIEGIQVDLAKPRYSVVNDSVYLDPKFPGLIRVKKSPLTWKDFFDQSPLSLDNNCLVTDDRSTYCASEKNTLKVMLNGILISDLYDRSLTNGDAVLISFGDETGIELQRQQNSIPSP